MFSNKSASFGFLEKGYQACRSGIGSKILFARECLSCAPGLNKNER